MIDSNTGVRVSMGPLAELPSPTGEGVGVGDFYTDIDTHCLYQLKRDQTTGVLTWIEAECPDTLPPAEVLPNPALTPGATIVVGGVTYVSVETAPGVFTWVPINGAPAFDFAEFYTVMPGDGVAPIAIGAAVKFPNVGATSAGGITPIGGPGFDQFQLAAVGVYRVDFNATFVEPAQVAVYLGLVPAPVAATVVGRATGTSQLVMSCLVTTTVPNELLSIVNHASPAAITLEAGGGGSGTEPQTGHLIITRVK